jgi:quercetin dioxygenase-like cupin family protein
MPPELSRFPIHLGRNATAVPQPEFTGMEWYGGYMQRHESDGFEGRLVSQYSFDKPWDSWEVHPHGHEVVICTAGEITLIQELGGKEVRTTLRPGEYAINPPGVWHTADSGDGGWIVTITPGLDTEHRPR